MAYKYKCVFSDLDRTFLNSEGKISDENRKAVGMLREIGIPFIPATGRSFGSLPKEIFDLPGVDLCITGNGCAVWSLKNKKTVRRSCLPKGTAEKLLEFAHGFGDPAVEVYADGKGYCGKEFYEDPAAFNQPRVEYVKTTRTPVADIDAFFLENDGRADGFTIISPAGLDMRIFEEAKKKFPDIYVTHSDGLYVEFSSLLSGKHNGMRSVCEILGLNLKDSVAFGDNDNDVEMLSSAGLGICVENGTESCKKAAGLLVPSNADNGFAYAVGYLFGNEKISAL